METQSPLKKYLPKIILVAVLISVGYYAYTRYEHSQMYESTDNAQIKTYQVPVLPRLAGYVKQVNIKDYDDVQKGELLVEIDDQEMRLALLELEATYNQMTTEVENARANIKSTELSLKAGDTGLKASNLRKEKAKKDAERDARLLAESAITKKQSDDSQSNYEILSATLEANQSDLNANRSKLEILGANLHRAEAQLAVQRAKIEQQKLRLSYAKIYAASAGKIGRKNVETGQYIQPGQTLATIVQDSLYWVIANFKETQLAKLKEGQEVNIKLDAFPDLVVKGNIQAFAKSTGADVALIPADNASGNFIKVTQKIPVKIAIKNLDKIKNLLRSGMSTEVEVRVK